MGLEVIEKFNNVEREEILKYQNYVRERQENFVREGYEQGLAFKTSRWRRANQDNRSLITRFTLHRFHHKICANDNYHMPSSQCECNLCGESAEERYHLISCPSREERLLTDWINNVANQEN